MQLASIAVTLRRRSPWEAIDLGFAMLRQWWRPVYASWALLFAPIAVASAAIGWMSGRFWIASLMIWWLKPLYDRLLLHVLSRAVFGEVISARTALAAAREWLATGLLGALTIFRFDAVRSFSLPVRQLEGQSGRQARARVALLSRRARSYAYWLTVVCMHFEAVFLLSGDSLLGLLMPAQAAHAANFLDLWRNAGDAEVWSTISNEPGMRYSNQSRGSRSQRTRPDRARRPAATKASRTRGTSRARRTDAAASTPPSVR